MKKVRLILLALAGAFLSSCASSSSDPGVPSGTLDIEWTARSSHVVGSLPLVLGNNRLQLPSGTPGEVSLIVRALGPGEADHGGPASSGEDQDGHWKSCVASMQLTLGEKLVEFPKAMVTPVCEPHWGQVQVVAGKVYIIIDGLDAAASYRAIFTVDKGLITERLIAHGEFPHQIWERTQYYDDFDEHSERYNNM
jgi:hypothetical protein